MVDVLATSVSWVGMDVHMWSIAAAATVAGTGDLRRAKLAFDVGQTVRWAEWLPVPVDLHAAGPTGGRARTWSPAGAGAGIGGGSREPSGATRSGRPG
jgi:hypothetical protein